METIVKYELRAQQFKIYGQNINRYNNKEWTNTEHDLDFIAEHKTGKLTIGVEVKNTLGIIPKSELEVKIKLCHFLGISPVFAVRWIKPYIYYVKQQNGFCWIFKTQMWPYSHRRTVKELYNKLSVLNKYDIKGRKLEFPITTRTELPEKSIQAFEKWINSKISP